MHTDTKSRRKQRAGNCCPVIQYTKNKSEVLIPQTLHAADRLISALQNDSSLIVTAHLLLRFNKTYTVQLT